MAFQSSSRGPVRRGLASTGEVQKAGQKRGRNPNWMHRMKLSFHGLLRRFKKRSSWGGPRCTCDAFNSTGKCKHLQPFQDPAVLRGEDMDDISTPLGHNLVSPSKSFSSNRSLATSSSVTGFSSHGGNPAGDRDSRPVEEDDVEFDPSEGVGEIRVPLGTRRLAFKLAMVDLLGRGTCGRNCYRASYDKTIVLAKALRCEPPHCLPNHQEIFNNELEILSSLKPHANIVVFLGYGEMLVEADVLERRVAFEFCVDSLGDRVRHRETAGERLGILMTRKYGIDILQGLTYLHSLGIAHRDLTSENIQLAPFTYPNSGNWASQMRSHFHLGRTFKNLFDATSRGGDSSVASKSLRGGAAGGHSTPKFDTLQFEDTFNTPTYVAKIGNFEVAKRLRGGQRSLTRVTSPVAMAPEMWLERPHNESVDIWGVGIILCDVLSKGKNPLAGMNLKQIEAAVTGKRFPNWGTLAPAKYKVLESLMRKCLVADPLQRPSSQALLASLTNMYQI